MSHSANKKIRVLFIDDDDSIRIFAVVMFNNKLFDIQIASSTQEADKLLKSHSFDIIVCDVMMPVEDGIHYCNRLKKSGISMPFLFLSAVSQPTSVEQGLAAGANAYYIKPFDAQELQRKIINLVAPTLGGHSPPSVPKDTKKRMNWFNR